MNNKLIAGLIIAGACAAPLATSALSIEDLQAQIRELLSRVASMQEEFRSRTSGNVETSVRANDETISVTAVPRICSMAGERALTIGVRNDEVRALQEFLRSEGSLDAEATGYFGTATRDALRTWQLQNKVVARADTTTGWGIAGPRTREAILRRCGNAGSLSVSPARGASPLTVVVTSKIGDEGPTRPSYVDGQDTLIDFGDGSERQWVQCEVAGDSLAGTCVTPAQYKHTYEKDGTYTVRLVRAGGMCLGGCPERLLGTAHVTIVGSTEISPADNPRCKAWHDGCNNCARDIPGSDLIMCTAMYCSNPSKAYCTAYFDETANRPPVISGFSGPVQLNLNEVGTWEIRASDPENGRLSYSIEWGDEWYVRNAAGSFGPTASIQQDTSFTHAYEIAGTYTVRVMVRDAEGKEVRASATVKVASTAYCTKEYVPVCGQPPEPACRRSIPACMMASPGPRTYSNRCEMNAASAELLYTGACTDSNGSTY